MLTVVQMKAVTCTVKGCSNEHERKQKMTFEAIYYCDATASENGPLKTVYSTKYT